MPASKLGHSTRRRLHPEAVDVRREAIRQAVVELDRLVRKAVSHGLVVKLLEPAEPGAPLGVHVEFPL